MSTEDSQARRARGPSRGAAKWFARAVASLTRVRSARLAFYVSGKHPSCADYLDPALLPPVPPAFRHFHDTLRFTLERAVSEPSVCEPGEPLLICWVDGSTSAILWACPTHDRGDRNTGRSRPSAFMAGAAAATVGLSELLTDVAPRLKVWAEATLASPALAVTSALPLMDVEPIGHGRADAAPTPATLDASTRARTAVATVGPGNPVIVTSAGRATVLRTSMSRVCPGPFEQALRQHFCPNTVPS